MDKVPLCAQCNNRAELSCPDCHVLLYCSGTCAAGDASAHQLICPAFALPPAKPISEQKHVLGILFPSEATAPALVWVKIDGFVDEDTGISFQEAETAPFFSRSGGVEEATVTPEALHCERNRVRNRETRSMLEVWHATSWSGQESKSSSGENKCIRALAAGRDGPFHRFEGPVLVLAMTRPTGFMVDPGAYQDSQLYDFWDALDFVLDHGNDLHARKIQEALNSLGDGRAPEIPTPQAVETSPLAGETSESFEIA
ncbi:hypothetical protein B0T25DRAFT_536785 [Lasiosphaeria hispida]|uniref:MYND-type domain-containing protein n=1 Tax=Lasiosphaeria hispida TaxID=260671 RepID=A0AAJ0HKS9_9PEZI|nr:hypothetical protein B0T25DRAFT_536785 [Lasiosphaeria hispida]